MCNSMTRSEIEGADRWCQQLAEGDFEIFRTFKVLSPRV